jgi:hypothetical protein
MPGGRFERHPRLTGAGLFAGAVVMLELSLRLWDPVPLRFAHAMRVVHGYSRTARVDLRPSRSVRLHIDRSDGQPLFDFRLSTGPEGFRVVEGQSPPAGVRYLHAIGDSYTMGWGEDAAESYPARLAQRLGPGTAVLNLGVDGFGAIGATSKSRALAERYPPACAVYLFCPNDFDDDVQAAAVARRGALAHAAFEALDLVRRTSYIAGLPFALRYKLQFQAGPAAAKPTASGGFQSGAPSSVDPQTLLLSEPAPAPAPPADRPTFAAIREYRDFLAARGARFLVMVLSNQKESLEVYRFCREQGIEAHLFDVPEALRIPDEGHFNARGNEAVAALVAQLLATQARDAAGS